MKIEKQIFILSILIIDNVSILAQDNNYWNQMPGSRSALLGGAVVGGVRDNSAIFYNPGALGFIDSSSVSITANSFQFETANVINGGGTGVDFESKKFQTVPLVSISGSFKFKPTSKATFGFMVFTKNQTSNSFSKRIDDSLSKSILGTYSETYYFSKNTKIGYIGDFNMRTGLNETWVGMGYAYKINKFISLGFTPFLAYRTQFYSKSFVARVMLDKLSNYANQGQVTSEGYSDISNVSSSNIRMLGKFGASFDFNVLKFGFSLTTRSYNLGGSTLLSRDITYNGGQADPGLTLTGLGQPKDTVVLAYMYNLNDRQEGLKTNYKSPISLAGGIEYQLKNTKFLISAEYFQQIDSYNIITPDSNNFYRSGKIEIPATTKYPYKKINSAKSDKYLKIVEANKSVFNFAVAIEKCFNKRFIEAINTINPKQFHLKGIVASVSYRTDKSSYKKASNDFWVYKYGYGDTTYTVGQRLSFSDINIQHINFGFTVQRKKSDLHIGFCYSRGSNKNFQTLNNIADPKDNVISNNLGAVPDFSNTANYIYKSYSLLLGYTYHLK